MRKADGNARVCALAIILILPFAVACGDSGPPAISGPQPPAATDGDSVAARSTGLAVAIADQGKLRPRTGRVALAVRVSCPGERQVLEAFVYLTQDGHTSNFAPLPVQCGPDRSRRYRVSISPGPDSPPFHKGAANATAHVLVQDPGTGATESAGDTRAITIR